VAAPVAIEARDRIAAAALKPPTEHVPVGHCTKYRLSRKAEAVLVGDSVVLFRLLRLRKRERGTFV
jgi:hypothetical protein